MDTGHFQFFNGALDTIVASNVGERMGGFFTYGQWHSPSAFFHNGWVLSPSYMMQFLGNHIVEGNAVKNYVGGAAGAEMGVRMRRNPQKSYHYLNQACALAPFAHSYHLSTAYRICESHIISIMIVNIGTNLSFSTIATTLGSKPDS